MANGKSRKKPMPVLKGGLEKQLLKLIAAAQKYGWDQDQGSSEDAEQSLKAQERAERSLRLAIIDSLAEKDELIETIAHARDVSDGLIEPCEGEELEGCESCRDRAF